MLKHFEANFIIQSQQKKLFDSISEGARKQQSYLSFFSVDVMYTQRRHQNRHAARVRDLFIATARQVPMRDWCGSAISKLKFSNTNLKIVSPMVYDTSARHLRNEI